MKKSLLLVVPLGLYALTSAGQVSLSTADLLRLGGFDKPSVISEVVKRNLSPGQAEKVEMIIRYESASTLSDIEELGGEIISVISHRYAIVSIDPSRAALAAGVGGVSGARLSRKIKLANDKAGIASNVESARSGIELPDTYDGSGTVVGLFDTGLDPNHINFKDEEGNTRVSRVWHYNTQSAKPLEYSTPARISTFTTDAASETHGTHVLGIMTGSFVDPSNPSKDYRGVAPGAEIVIGAGEGYDAQILDAVKRIASYAVEQSKPCVINLSFGDNLGPHDGTDEFTEALNDVASEYDAVLCLAGGNERDEPIAIVKTLTQADPEIATLLVKPADCEIGGNFQCYSPIEIWTTDDTPFEVELEIINRSNPDSPLYTFTVPTDKESYVVQGDNIKNFLTNTGRMNLISSGTEFHNLYTNSFMGGLCGVDPYNHKYNARMNVYIEGRTSTNASRYFVKVRVKGAEGQKIFMYCDGYYMNFGNRNIPGLDVPDGEGTNSNMACGSSTFSVGSYVSANRSESVYPTGIVGEISYFSSYGETLDGRVMPDIVAPGQVIISSRNTSTPTSASATYVYPLSYQYTDPVNRKVYSWTCCAGTSQASPHVAGIFALMRGANPNLSAQAVYEMMRESAADPESTEPGWGYGKADAFAAIKKAVFTTSVYELSNRGTDGLIIETSADGYIISAPEETGLTAEIFDMAGMLVSKTSSVGDTLHVFTDSFPKGIYVMRVKGSFTSRSIKICKH